MPDADVDERDWVSAHAFYHGDLDELLADAVWPLVDELTATGSIRTGFFLRYWEGGPHIRLRVLPATGPNQVRETITTRLGGYLAAHPSEDRLDQRAYAELARSFAAREPLGSYEKTLHPNNTVAFIPYRREHRRFGPAMAAVERHFAESSAVVRALLAKRPRQRASIGYSLIVLAGLVAEPDRAILAASWERFGDYYRQEAHDLDLDADYRREGARYLALTRRLRTAAGRLDGSGSDAPLAQWGRSIRALREHTGHDVIDICAHLACNRLGLFPRDEAILRHHAMRSIRRLETEE
ncbi:lantibiotic dehydratase C-terminal domain-containing protein [Saccharopolyspora shandongensis]|uniref:lantibiotic dehydratase C-terminal domain-containing protein n=1 Tax=Saccharopolyspora shandongensis TaxID=418495 RepID=UPI003419CE00